jgi:hypothetical protein
VDNPASNGTDPEGSYSGPDSEPRETRAVGAEARVRRPGMLTYAFAGLEAGITGILWMFGCFFVASYWSSSGLWSVPNLFATVFYGDYAYEGDFRRSTWAGIALIVVIYGLLGLLWGCFWKENRKPLLSFYGAMAGLAVYFIFFNFIWTHLNPLIPLYAPVRQLEVAHILWGAALAGSPGYARRIAVATLPPPVFSAPAYPAAPANPPAGHDDAESVSGEVIQ